MAFQRSYSKVWWGSDNNTTTASSSLMSSLNFYNASDGIPRYDNNNSRDFYSLDSNIIKYSGNLSRIQEVEENSKLWNSHNSPGSLRSQDSGFSDHDDSPTNPSSLKSDSPQSIKTIPTPPTVIRRNINENYNNINSSILSNRRLSFSAPTSPTFEKTFNDLNTSTDLINQIDRLSFVNGGGHCSTPKKSSTPLSGNTNFVTPLSESCKCTSTKDRSIRRRRLSRKTRQNILTRSFKEKHNLREEYNNETVFLGVGDDDNNASNNNSSIQSDDENDSLQLDQINESTITLPYCDNYENIEINVSACQYWLDDLYGNYESEIMSTLQTKSIAREAFRNLKITTNAVAKIIRQLQQRSMVLQNDFETFEKYLKSSKDNQIRNHKEILNISLELLESVDDFTRILERRSVFFTEYRTDRKKFEDNIEHIQLIVKDLKYSLNNQQYLEIDSLIEDIEVLKRYILITIRLVFEKLVKVIVVNIENCNCDLMLRANLNMIATLSNIDYNGFASLSDAFLSNDTERILLLICIENKLSTVRALALRGLATICTTPESIKKFCNAGGIEILRDILCNDLENRNDIVGNKNMKNNEAEKRETVSLLAQLTAPWHGADHKVDGIRDSIEGIVEGITDIITNTKCCQTLLLCAASLNNLSSLEMTSVYSIMSNETIVKLKDAVENRSEIVSIFLCEQIATMLFNMTTNKKCHSHLANKNIINFITYIFQSQFYQKFQTRAECNAHHKTIKIILHIFKRLIHESLVGQEILENNFIPIFSKVEKDLMKTNSNDYQDDIHCNETAMHYFGEYEKDIIYLNKQLNESLSNKSFYRSTDCRSSNSKLNSMRQESYV